MAHITHLRVEGLRAHDHDLELGPLTVIKGPVGSGKTTASDAVRIAFLGCVPSIGRDSTAISRIIRDRLMSVDLTLNDGRSLSRGCQRRGQSIKSVAEASWMPPLAGLADTVKEIRSLVGRDDREASEHLDLRELLTVSPNKRAARIEELLDASGIPLEELILRGRSLTALRLAKVQRFPEAMEALEAAATGAVHLLETDAHRRALARIVSDLETNLLEGGIGRALPAAGVGKRNAAEDLRRRIAARAEMEDRVRDLDAPAAAVEEAERRRGEAANRKAAAERDLKEAERVSGIRAQLEPAIPGLTQTVTDAEAALTAAREKLPAAVAAREEAEALSEPAAIVAPETVPPRRLSDEDRLGVEALEADAEHLTHAADELEIPEPISVAKEEAAYSAAAQAKKNAEDSPWREVEEIADRLDHLDAAKNEVRLLRELAEEYGGDPLAPVNEMKEAYQALLRAKNRQGAREDEIAETLGRRAKLRTSAAEARKIVETTTAGATAAADKENRRRRDVYAKAMGEREVQVDGIRTRRKALLDIHAATLAAANEAQATLDKATADLRAATERLAGIESVTVDPDVARNEISCSIADLDEMRKALDVLRGADALRAEMKALLLQIDEATAGRDAWAAAEWALQRLREMDLAARATGLQDRMRRYLRAAGRTEEPYLRAGRGVCDFGLRRDGAEISVEALSGGEHALYVTALAGAIVSLRAPEVRIVLVEANEVGVGKESGQLFRLCSEMVTSGDLDQVLISTNLPMSPPEGWTEIEMGAAVHMEIVA